MTDADLDALRGQLRDLLARGERGDIPEREFERTHAERTLALYRAAVTQRLVKGEKIVHEHHVLHAHLRVSQSVLKEPEQRASSLFLTERHLLRLTSTLLPGRPATCDDRDGTRIDVVDLASIRRLRTRRQIRPGEIAAGAATCAVALLAWSSLAVTGPLLLALGVAGMLHGLLLPTRWCEVDAAGEAPAEPVRILALRERSARLLVRLLRERLTCNQARGPGEARWSHS